ncbi:hypothetical protein S245_065018 [Arachis hypogaea]|uniref:Uncharacterized protein n=1 Tax=Arachis hypogaea TaxID=3818 RepID=A0A6B9V349_ARAHY|nr:uncharacterized protein DS421_19g635040 [Arachis hypogaea]
MLHYIVGYLCWNFSDSELCYDFDFCDSVVDGVMGSALLYWSLFMLEFFYSKLCYDFYFSYSAVDGGIGSASLHCLLLMLKFFYSELCNDFYSELILLICLLC